MFPASTHKGQAVLSFPDVCKTPAPPAPPVPIPYPSIGAKQASPRGKGQPGTKKPVAAKGASQADLLAGLDELHGQLKSMKHRDANLWHAVVDDYVIAAAALFASK